MPKTARIEIENKKWVVEYQEGNKALEISPNAATESVHIYKCNDCVIQIKGKVNALILVNCNNTGLVCQDVIASLEATNCKKLQLQFGVVPTVQLDNVSGCALYAQKDNRDNTNFVTAGCSEINIISLDGDNEPEETPVPEQFVSIFQNGTLVTKPNSHI